MEFHSVPPLVERVELLEFLRLPHLEKLGLVEPYLLAHHIGSASGQTAADCLARPDVEGRGTLAIDCVHVRRVVLRSQEVHTYDYSVKPYKRWHLSPFVFLLYHGNMM